MLATTIHSLGSRDEDAGTYVLVRTSEVPDAYIRRVSDVRETLSIETAPHQQEAVGALRHWAGAYLSTNLGDVIPRLIS